MWDRTLFKAQVDVIEKEHLTVKVAEDADVCFAVGLGGPSTFCVDDSSVELAECGECVRLDYGMLMGNNVGSPESGRETSLRVTEGKVCVVSLVPQLQD